MIDNASNILTENDVVFPASTAQQRLWFLDRLHPGNPVYNMSQVVRIRGSLDHLALKNSINTIIQRHSVLRTTFAAYDTGVYQFIEEDLVIDLPIIDLQSQNLVDDESRIQQLVDEKIREPFNLEQGPLIRVELLQIVERDYVFLVVVHHIVFDRWSIEIFNRELSSLYQSFVNDEKAELPELPVQYVDYTQEKYKLVNETLIQKQLSYWEKKLADWSPLELPEDKPRSDDYSGERLSFALPSDLLKNFERIANKQGVTLFMGLLAVFKILLWRWSGQTDIIVGTPFADRRMLGTERLLGFFVNTLVLRTDLSEQPDFYELLKRIKKTCFNAYRYNSLPFERLVEELQPPRQPNRNPVFNVEFALQKAHVDSLQLCDLSLSPITASKGVAQYDLTFTVREQANAYDMRVEYRKDLFNKETIQRLQQQFGQLLEGVAQDPEKSIAYYSLLDEKNKDKIIKQWNKTNADYPQDLCLHELFINQAKDTPDAIALVDQKRKLTYRELDEKSNQLAFYLSEKGVGPEVYVAICIERSVDMVVGLLAILKAGGAYIPLDKEYPESRLQHMLDDSAASVLLTQSWLLDKLPVSQAVTVLIDKDSDAIQKKDKSLPETSVSPCNLAYVIYTSGSTGKPKGIQVQHGNVVNFLTSMKSKPGISNDDILLSVTTLSFDIAVLEIYLPLIVGAKTIVVDYETTIDADKLYKALIDYNVTFMQATPVTWRLLMSSEWQGSDTFKALCGGEAMPRDLAAYLYHRAESVWNMYGPTETTVWSTCYRLTGPSEPIYIGRPINNTEIYILDKDMQPVPVGMPGELYIGGDGVTRGYLNRADLTAERFIDNPFNADKNSRLYMTGDAARYLPDGNIEYHNRLDNQVKVRGNRIELDEIEAALNSQEYIEQSVVILREDTPGDVRIVAYYVADGKTYLPATELRRHVRDILPAYMVPQYFIELSSLPLTPNKKIDRKALLALSIDMGSEKDAYIPPRSQHEKQLAGIWQDALGLERVGIHDNFIELGGHSLLALQVIARVKKEMNLQITSAAMLTESLEQLLIDDKSSVDYEEVHSASIVQAFYFGEPDKTLLGIYHPPGVINIKQKAVLLCYPLFLEGANAHSVYRRLAMQLSAAGYHVMRFDYYGTGDSSGDLNITDPAQWIEDITIAAKQLMQLSDVNSVSLIGLRLGAMLATMIDDIKIDDLILWDPVLEGKDYLADLEEKNKTVVNQFNKVRGHVVQSSEELLGFVCSYKIRHAIREMSINSIKTNVEKVFLFTPKEKSDLLALRENYSGSKSVVYREVHDEDGEVGKYTELSVFMPVNALHAIQSALNGDIA